MLVSFVHSIKMCYIVYWFPHEHLGGGSSFRMKEWVNLVCPMHSWARVVSALLLKWAILGRACCVWAPPTHNCFHFFVIICLIFSLRSVYGIFDILLGTILRAALANEFALSFPKIPIWLGIQQNITFLL